MLPDDGSPLETEQSETSPFKIEDAAAGQDQDDDMKSAGPESPEGGKKANEDTQNKPDAADDEDEEDTDEGFVVEDILDHRNVPGIKEWQYQIKWKGFDDPKDITWEPESNCENSKELIDEYWKRRGGREEFVYVEATRRRKRKSETVTPKKRSRKSISSSDEEWQVPLHLPSWENEIKCIDTLERDSKDNQLLAYITWPNGRKTKHNIQLIYDKCPRRVYATYYGADVDVYLV